MPKPEGYRFLTDGDSEMHYLLKAILLRPIYLQKRTEDDNSNEMIILRSYRELCTPPENEPPWPALSGGPGAPGPFERGWQCFWQKQRIVVMEAQRKTLSLDGNAESWSSPSLWNTKEMEDELEKAWEHHLEGDDANELDERTGASIRHSFVKRIAPEVLVI